MAQLSVEDATKLLGGSSSSPKQLSPDEAMAILKPQKNLGTQPSITLQANSRGNFKPFDWKDQQQQSMKDEAKKAGPTRFWESSLLGASDLGAGVVQGASYAADKISEAANNLLGTNLDTNSYNRVTQQRKDVQDFHNLRRQENGQGYDVARLGGQIAATAPLGALAQGYGRAAVLSRSGLGVAAHNAAVGAAIGGAGFAEDAKQRLTNTALGGIGGAVGGAVGEKVGRGINSGVRRLKNLSPQANQQAINSIDQKLDAALRQNGMSLGELSDEVANGLRNDAKKLIQSGTDLNPDAVARKAVLDQLGLKGTRAQVTGDAQTWQTEAELAKLKDVGSPLRDKYIQDNKQLENLLDSASSRTGGSATDQYGAMQSALDAVTGQLDQNKQFIRAAYSNARTAPGNDVPLDGAGFANDAFTALEQNYAASSLPKGIQSILNDVAKNPDKFTLGKSEELIKILNREYQSSLQMGQPTSSTYSIGLVRDALSQRQNQAMQGLLGNGNDAAQAYQFARQANKFNMDQIESMPLLQDARKDVKPDRLFNKHILNGNVDELDKTIQLLNNINPQSVANIKQQTLQFIAEKAIKQNGQFSPAGMKRALDGIGDRRLSILFSNDELKNIKNISRAGEYLVTQPPHSYVNNSNTSSAGINSLMNFFNNPKLRAVANLPYVKDYLVDPVSNFNKSRAVDQAMKPSIAGSQIRQTATPQEQDLLQRLVQAGLLGGANTANQ